MARVFRFLRDSIKKHYPIVFIVMISLPPLFIDLGKFPIQMWDEATYSNNAIDMYLNPSLIVVKSEGIPETYNSKPPFVIWLQAISFYVFGLNEFALRFPSALFGLLTILLVYTFVRHMTSNNILAFFSSILLVTIPGFVSIHGTRTGDFDATLVFFITLYSLTFFRYLFSNSKDNLLIIIITASIICAFLTKGIAGFFLIPFLIIITIFHGRFVDFLKDKRWYYAAAIVLSVVFLYYYARELLQPGYLYYFYREEFSRFYADTYLFLHEPFNFYFFNLWNFRLVPHIYLLPVVMVSVFLIFRKPEIKKLYFYILFCSVGYLFLISASNTKLVWYDMVCFPFFAIVLSIAVFYTLQFVFEKMKIANFKYLNIFIPMLLLMIFPYIRIMQQSIYDGDSERMYDMEKEGAYMRSIKQRLPDLKDYVVLKKVIHPSEHYDQIKFYKRTYEINDGSRIEISDSIISDKHVYLTCQHNFILSLKNHSGYIPVDSCIGCFVFSPFD